MRPSLFLVLSACVVPPLDATGKTCSETCPAPLACQAGICVAEGGRLCAAWPDPRHACFDFEGSTTIDAPQAVTGGALQVDTSSRRFGANSLEVSLSGSGGLGVARLSLPVPGDWQRIAASYDLRADLPATLSGGLSFGELLCAGNSYTGLWLFYEGAAPRWVARTDTTTTTDLLPAPTSAAWTRITLELSRSPSLRGTVRLGGTEAASAPVTDCGGVWTVEVGISGEVAASAWYDDVVVTVDR